MDGIVLKTKTGFGTKKKVVFVAYVISIHGRRELIDFMVTKHENKKRWEAFLNNLYNFIIMGSQVNL